MQQGRVLAVSIVGTIVMAIFLAYALGSCEPVSRGKPLSFWFEQLSTPNLGEAEVAIREMGPKAVPFLLKKARSKDGDSPSDKLYRMLYNKAPVSIKRRIPLPKPYDDNFHYRVANALQLLGPPAGPAL